MDSFDYRECSPLVCRVVDNWIMNPFVLPQPIFDWRSTGTAWPLLFPSSSNHSHKKFYRLHKALNQLFPKNCISRKKQLDFKFPSPFLSSSPRRCYPYNHLAVTVLAKNQKRISSYIKECVYAQPTGFYFFLVASSFGLPLFIVDTFEVPLRIQLPFLSGVEDDYYVNRYIPRYVPQLVCSFTLIFIFSHFARKASRKYEREMFEPICTQARDIVWTLTKNIRGAGISMRPVEPIPPGGDRLIKHHDQIREYFEEAIGKAEVLREVYISRGKKRSASDLMLNCDILVKDVGALHDMVLDRLEDLDELDETGKIDTKVAFKSMAHTLNLRVKPWLERLEAHLLRTSECIASGSDSLPKIREGEFSLPDFDELPVQKDDRLD